MSTVFNVKFSDLREPDVLDRLLDVPVPAGNGAQSLVTANLDHIVQLSRRPDFREAYRHAWLATMDGMPVYVYAKLRGHKEAQHVAGADLVQHLIPRLDPAKHRIVFVASNPETGSYLCSHLRERGFPRSSVTAVVPEFGFEKDEAQSESLARAIREHGATHVFFGVGCPKSEIWVFENRSRLGDCYVLNVGASLEFYAGAKVRAPKWVRRAGFEWAWRFASEPRRLGGRYVLGAWHFLAIIAADLRAGSRT